MNTNMPARCLLLACLFAVAGCKQQLYTSLSERDANEMIAVLAARNLHAEKVTTDKGDFRIELNRSDFSAAVESLRDHGLPRPKFSSIGEVFKKEGLVTTANAERLRFMFAMSEELSKTLSLIDGVVEARVHPVLPGGDPLTDKLTPASASVFIKHTPDANLTLLAPAIKDLVCASIEGLTYDKVSLTFVPASKMVVTNPQTQIKTTTTERSALSNLPTLGIGLAAGFLILGIGLVSIRRPERSASAVEQFSPDRPAAMHPTTLIAQRLILLAKQGWGKLTGSKPAQRKQGGQSKPSKGSLEASRTGGPHAAPDLKADAVSTNTTSK